MKIIAGIFAILGIILTVISALALRVWFIFIVVLSVLKIAGFTNISWFASIYVPSAIGTGLWILGIGFIVLVIGSGITLISASFLD